MCLTLKKRRLTKEKKKKSTADLTELDEIWGPKTQKPENISYYQRHRELQNPCHGKTHQGQQTNRMLVTKSDTAIPSA